MIDFLIESEVHNKIGTFFFMHQISFPEEQDRHNGTVFTIPRYYMLSMISLRIICVLTISIQTI